MVPVVTELEGKKAVFVDNCSAHLSVEVLELCEEHDVFFVPLPPNSTWLTQPCDVALFGPLKAAWHHVIIQFNMERIEAGLAPFSTIPRAHFTTLLERMFQRMDTTEVGGTGKLGKIVRSAFRTTGICPLDRSPVLASELKFFQLPVV